MLKKWERRRSYMLVVYLKCEEYGLKGTKLSDLSRLLDDNMVDDAEGHVAIVPIYYAVQIV